MKYDTIEEATQAWVNKMNAIPQSLLEKAYPNMDEDGLYELTPITTKWECDACGEEFSQEEIDELEEKQHQNSHGEYICPSCFKDGKEQFEEDEDNEDDEEGYTLDYCQAVIQEIEDDEYREYGLPMWGWLWNPDSFDEDWIRENLQEVADCGFRIYESDEVGILLGIDGAGYDFYESHWIPLYKARGLKWHKSE